MQRALSDIDSFSGGAKVVFEHIGAHDQKKKVKITVRKESKFHRNEKELCSKRHTAEVLCNYKDKNSGWKHFDSSIK